MSNLYNNIIIFNTKCNDGYITDFTFNINYNNEITQHYVHSFVLIYEYFVILIQGSFNKQKTLNIDILHAKTGNDFIKFLYTAKLDFDYNNLEYDRVHSLFVLADQFQIDELINFCTNLLALI